MVPLTYIIKFLLHVWKTYRSGENNFRTFSTKYQNILPLAFPKPLPSIRTLTLCFFATSLFLKVFILSANTIRSYVRHVKNYRIQMGCGPTKFEYDVLPCVKRDIEASPKEQGFETRFFTSTLWITAMFSVSSFRKKLCTVGCDYFGYVAVSCLQKCDLESLVLVEASGTEYVQ